MTFDLVTCPRKTNLTLVLTFLKHDHIPDLLNVALASYIGLIIGKQFQIIGVHICLYSMCLKIHQCSQVAYHLPAPACCLTDRVLTACQPIYLFHYKVSSLAPRIQFSYQAVVGRQPHVDQLCSHGLTGSRPSIRQATGRR